MVPAECNEGDSTPECFYLCKEITITEEKKKRVWLRDWFVAWSIDQPSACESVGWVGRWVFGELAGCYNFLVRRLLARFTC